MMKMFGKKDAIETPSVPEAQKPGKKGATYRPRGIETVCPETGAYQQRFYLAPSQALGERLKDFPLILNGGDDQPSRLQWQFAIAVEAINTLDRYPLQSIVNVHGDDKWDFHRAAFLRALVSGLGDWLNCHQPKNKKGLLIDVVAEGWGDAVSLAPAKESLIPVSSGMLEWSLCEQLTSKDHPSDYLTPEVYRLFLDSFGTDAHPRNPIAGAVHQAREKMVKRLGAKGVALHKAVGVIPSKNRSPAPAPSQNELSTASDSNAEATEAPKPPQKPVEKPQRQKEQSKTAAPSAQAMKKAGIEMAAEPKKQPEPSAPSNPEPTQSQPPRPAEETGDAGKVSLQHLVDVIRQRIDSGIVTTNQAGAIFHGTPNGPALIVPKGYDVIAQVLKADMADVEALAQRIMIDSDQSFPKVSYRLHRKGRGWAKIKAGVLNPNVASMLFPEGLEENPDIKVG